MGCLCIGRWPVPGMQKRTRPKATQMIGREKGSSCSSAGSHATARISRPRQVRSTMYQFMPVGSWRVLVVFEGPGTNSRGARARGGADALIWVPAMGKEF